MVGFGGVWWSVVGCGGVDCGEVSWGCGVVGWDVVSCGECGAVRWVRWSVVRCGGV